MKQIILLATIALSLWSCSPERVLEVENPPTGAIAYDPTEVVTIVTDLATRGTPISSAAELTDVGLFCSYTGNTAWNVATDKPNKMFNTKLVQAGGAWQYDLPQPCRPIF